MGAGSSAPLRNPVDAFKSALRAQTLERVQAWAEWVGYRPDGRSGRRRQIRQEFSPGAPSLLGKLQAEGAEHQRRELQTDVPAGPAVFVIDNLVLHTRDWHRRGAWPSWAKQAYRERYGTPGRRTTTQVWASTIHGDGARQSDPVSDAILAVDRAVAAMPARPRRVLLEQVFEPGTVEEKAARLKCATRTYYRDLDRALECVREHLP